MCTCANLRKATRLVTQIYDGALQPTGLRATQFSLMATVEKLQPIPLTQLADALGMDRTTLTRNLKPLTERGLIRVDHEEDQRVRIINLTADGADVFAKAVPHWEVAQSRMVDNLGPEGWSSLLNNLDATVSLSQGR